MVKKFSTPRGTSDILPDETPLWQHTEALARDIFERYGYKEIRTPIFEETGLFARSMGETSDVVQKQMLNLVKTKPADGEGEQKEGFSLRPEATASVVRAYIENSFDRKEALSKLYYAGPMFRGERPQKGRLRQFHQLGVEAIGPNSASPYLDAEVIALSVRLLEALGLKNFELKINTLGSPKDKENFSKKLREQIKPHLNKLSEDSRSRFERNVFRILDSKDKADQNVIAGLDLGHSYLSAESLEYYTGVKAALDLLGVKYKEDFRLVRGLDYYTHTVFEICDSSLGSQNALGAGGRYNNLVSELGGADADAIGFALGVERILLALPAEQKSHGKVLDFFMVALDDAAYKKAFELLAQLRGRGIAGDMGRMASMKSQMRLADKLGARNVLILGEDELSQGIVTIKNMIKGEQVQEKIWDLATIQSRLLER